MKKMRKTKQIIHIVLFSCALVLFNACSSDDLDLKTPDNISKVEKDFEVVNISDYIGGSPTTKLRSSSNDGSSQTVLRFKDEAAYERTIAQLEAMSEEERSQWTKSLDGFNSLQAIFEKAMIDVDGVDETEESYMSFKAKYDKYLYFPMYEEDYGVYIPIIDQYIAPIANSEGLILVGDEVRNLKDIANYSDLQQSGRAYYDFENDSNIQTRSTKTWNIDGTNQSQYIGQEASSGWHKENGKKLKLKFGRRSNKKNINPTIPRQGELPQPGGQFAMNLHLEVSFRKKTWVGWVNYSSVTDTQMTIKYLGRTRSVSLHKNNYSSHDWFDSENLPWTSAGVNDSRVVFSTPQVDANFITNFRGFKNTYRWACTLPVAYFIEK